MGRRLPTLARHPVTHSTHSGGKGKGKGKGGKGEGGEGKPAEGEGMSAEELKETIGHLRGELDHEREERNYFQRGGGVGAAAPEFTRRVGPIIKGGDGERTDHQGRGVERTV